MNHEGFEELKRELEKQRAERLTLPPRFSFKEHDVYNFDRLMSFFNWEIHNTPVEIDLTQCHTANYQALSLLAIYGWQLKSQGCRVTYIENDRGTGASAMWRSMGARGLFPVLFNEEQQFKGHQFKPLFALRNAADFGSVIQSAESYTKGFNVEYESTLRYVLSELLYNTMEHGTCYQGSIRIPSLVQFTWYKSRNEIQFIIADLGIGIKKHIEQAFPPLESDEEAIEFALRAKVSGTFGRSDPYRTKNNAGMGLYISSNIIRRLNADMHVLSRNGLVHISPRDVTQRRLNNPWPGTLVLVSLRLERNTTFLLHKMMQEFRDAADKEQKLGDSSEENSRFVIGIFNFFGKYAEDKEAAIKFRDKRIFPAIDEGKSLIIDFDNVVSSPHSFLSALLASPIKILGMNAYKKIKVVNAAPEIRETIDFILDDNT
ncbi:ATP-binding protein [Pseudomonas kilonensis]